MSYFINNQSKWKHTLWFDVEENYGTAFGQKLTAWETLWFDVEEDYETPPNMKVTYTSELWFDVDLYAEQ